MKVLRSPARFQLSNKFTRFSRTRSLDQQKYKSSQGAYFYFIFLFSPFPFRYINVKSDIACFRDALTLQTYLTNRVQVYVHNRYAVRFNTAQQVFSVPSINSLLKYSQYLFPVFMVSTFSYTLRICNANTENQHLTCRVLLTQDRYQRNQISAFQTR